MPIVCEHLFMKILIRPERRNLRVLVIVLRVLIYGTCIASNRNAKGAVFAFSLGRPKSMIAGSFDRPKSIVVVLVLIRVVVLVLIR